MLAPTSSISAAEIFETTVDRFGEPDPAARVVKLRHHVRGRVLDTAAEIDTFFTGAVDEVGEYRELALHRSAPQSFRIDHDLLPEDFWVDMLELFMIHKKQYYVRSFQGFFAGGQLNVGEAVEIRG